ncbi:ABC transporter ATP-binding protein [Rheinheimera sp. UJ63]|uniref:ABC transporter ATP-binding protein n=1 Tax=Rheinheimera sp. UJ63 TaxID=2910157 RepID=UPI001F402F48|nr:ABC transporter ATP-binding protein [Rheinheimera sp. UJ63]MCF4008333.1 ABC transporter ATP-binding protein [Rheinheimera sp. UJ63]
MGSITLKQVTKNFGDVNVIRPLDLAIRDGEFIVFVGPSGCGKSTLLRMIAGLEDTSSGIIEIDGQDATQLAPAKRGLAMVFQSYALYPHMSVRNNIAFPLKRAKVPAAEIAQKIDAAAKMLNLTDYLDRKPGQLSGGQRQRVAIGRAIVRQPSAFLFDEPLSNLDASLRVNMRLEITELHKSLGTTMVYVTHDQVEAMTMADRIAVFNGGVIEQVGTPLELYKQPVNKFVAGFIGSPKMNFIEVEAQANQLTRTLGVRPEHFKINEDAGMWTGKVGVIEHLGSESFLHVHVDGIGTLTVKADGDSPIRSGDQIRLSAADDKIHKFDAAGNSLNATPVAASQV